MQEKARLLAYCGFYCGDCLGYTGVIADAARGFLEVLETHRFERTAECVFPEQLGDYDRLNEALNFMAGLRCPGRCRTTEPEPSGCAVKKCCIEKGFFACYECDGFESCETLDSLHGGLHTASCVKNLRAIREMGLGAWLLRGKRHCYWMEDNDKTIR
jgi:hypothetical protein